MKKFQHFAVYGGGSWGTALACALARTMKKIDLYLRSTEIVNEIIEFKTNSKYLGDIRLPENIYPSNQISVLKNQQVIVIAVPSNSIITTIEILKNFQLDKNVILLIATKGLSSNPVQLLSDRINDILPNPIAFISGPNFAAEVAQNLLTAMTIACEDIKIAAELAGSIESENLEMSITDDIITIQIAGAIKNIIAIKSGIYDAMGHGKNAKAWLITQGLQEIGILSQALGGKFDSLLQAGVLGDLMLTCYSKTSRNTKFGYELYGQKDVQKFLASYPYLVEGTQSAKLVLELAKKYDVVLPVISSVAQLL